MAGPVTCSIGIAGTSDDLTLIQAATKAHRRMEVVQTMRKLRRIREGGVGAVGSGLTPALPSVPLDRFSLPNLR